MTSLAALAAGDAQAQSAIWGYGFVAAGTAELVSAVVTSYERDNLTPTGFRIYRNVDSTIAWGGGIELQAPRNVGIAAEVGAVHRIDEPYYPGGLLAVNAVYHLRADRPLAPFVTGGYSFGLDAQHGLDFGGGVHYWLTDRTGLRLEMRATRLNDSFQSALVPDVSQWLFAVRGGLSFARRRF